MSSVIDETKDLIFIPNELDSANSSYKEISSSHPITNAFTDSLSDTYAYISCNTGSNATTYVSLKFPIKNIPTNATLESIVCKAKLRVSSEKYFYRAAVQLYKGTTAMGSSVSALSQSPTVYTISNPGTWSLTDLANLEIRYTAMGRSGGRTTYLYFYGADLTITYSINGIEYEITSTLATDAVDFIAPSGVTYVEENGEYELNIYANSINNFKVEDNGVDVTNQLVQHEGSPGGTLEKAPSSYETSGTINGTRYQSTIGHTAENPSSQTGSDYSSNSGSSADIDYIFDFSDIPHNAIIDSVSVSVRGHLENTGNSSERADMRLYSGTSAKGSQISFTSTDDMTLTFSDVGTWTREELQSAKLRFTIGHYGGLIVGITWTVNYSLSSSTTYYWTYTLSNVSDDHTIVISDSIIEIPEENPDYNYYPITISSINATTTPGKGTVRVVEGTTKVITIVPRESKITLVTDNGVDITGQLVLHSKEPSYTVTTSPGARYGFSLNESTGYYVSTNKGRHYTASVARVNFNLPVKCLITIEYINYAEAGHDYGMFGNIDTTVATDGLTNLFIGSFPSDKLDNYYYICNSSSDNTNTPKTLTYEIAAGEHFIDIKYGKDDGTSSGNDNLQWKILSIEKLEANNYYTYTLTNISESHSLIFIFGDVTYYFVNSSGSNSKLFPTGSLVYRPGDNYSLTIVPDNYSYSVSVKDNDVDVTGYVERKEQIVQKEGQDITVVNYIYRLNDVQASHTIVVNCFPSTFLHIKIQSTWVKVNRVYKKEDGRWSEITDSNDLTNLFDTSKVYNTIFL